MLFFFSIDIEIFHQTKAKIKRKKRWIKNRELENDDAFLFLKQKDMKYWCRKDKNRIRHFLVNRNQFSMRMTQKKKLTNHKCWKATSWRCLTKRKIENSFNAFTEKSSNKTKTLLILSSRATAILNLFILHNLLQWFCLRTYMCGADEL